MNPKQFAKYFVFYFGLVLAVTAIITLLWNAFFHRQTVVSWQTVFTLAIILGVILAWTRSKK